MRVNPCKDCHDRYVGCHASCGAYLSWSEERRELNRIRVSTNKVLADVNDIHALPVKRVKNGQEALRKRRNEKNR